MKRLPFLLLALPFPFIALPLVQAADGQPNIVLVMSDDQGYGDIGLHGNDKIETPTLDRFAGEGVRLTRFYVSPVCSPTRASLMTGRYHYRTGIIHTSRGGAMMHGDEQTVAELLKAAGYRTGIFGKWHLGDTYPMRPQDQGFDESLIHTSGGIGQPPDSDNQYQNPHLWHNGRRMDTTGYCTDVFFSRALEFIATKSDKPLFAYIPTNVPHTPLQINDDLAQPFLDKGLDQTTARIYAMVKNLDDNFSRLLARLGELNIRDNTIVIFMTDNGAQQERFNAGLRGRKSWVYEGGIRVPCFIQWPARIQGGRQIDRMSAHIDILPTLLAAAGVTPPTDIQLDGINLLPLFMATRSVSEGNREGEAPAEPSDRTLFIQCHRGLTPKLFQNATAITQRYKLVAYPGTFGREDLLPSATEPVLELYDIDSDPGEQNNLAAEKPEVTADLRRQYEDWFADVWRSRQFTPGVIHLGNQAENPVLLCRYQDAQWKFDQSHGWLVNVERAGRYEFSLRPDDVPAIGRLVVKWQGNELTDVISAKQPQAVMHLAQGQGTLDLHVVTDEASPTMPTGKNISGDCFVRFLSASPAPAKGNPKRKRGNTSPTRQRG
jgi:arylsulfatase A-like enzyme